MVACECGCADDMVCLGRHSRQLMSGDGWYKNAWVTPGLDIDEVEGEAYVCTKCM